MNVMAEAHKQARELLAARPNIAYRVALILALINAHKAYKTMIAKEAVQNTIKLALIDSTLNTNPATASWHSLEGTATDSEGNTVYIAEGGSSSLSAQCSADWYFCRSNGFTNINLYIVAHVAQGIKNTYKIVR